ncbi:MAG: YkgJ family cysteine cluster protein [Cyclobacteriaceae bacterium]|nr:YkgJ family cysteine cluster protein [Cyclobacteriaceae bacterium]
MRIEATVAAVNLVFENLDKQIATFQGATSLHCNVGCGKCCFKPDIEATVLEFLPFALHLYKENQAIQWLDQLDSIQSPTCLLLNPMPTGSGLCTEYPYRGLICRLFGYSARTTKYAKKELVTCSIIKNEQTEAYTKAIVKIEAGLDVPTMNQYYMQLQSIDYNLTAKFYPINEAIKRAIETVMQYYLYENPTVPVLA